MSIDDVQQISNRFYTGMNCAINGDPSVMSELPAVCSQADDISVMSEMGGRQLGWPEGSSFFHLDMLSDAAALQNATAQGN